MSLSLESGIHAEVRYALDHLIKLSIHQGVMIDLEQCEDLVDIILDCGEAQVELLERSAPEVSDVIHLNSYEEVVRDVKVEMHGLQNIHEAGTLEYDLNRAADRLVAVTTLLRNFSFVEKNHTILAANPVIKFISNTVRLLGTRNMFLRSHNNTQDFMKDVVTFLSYVSDKVSLPSREEALNILHFLLSFAPSPAPTASKNVRFSFYDPRIHRYYPLAIDSLAKLLARDDPNKAHFKHIFTDNIPSPSTAHLPPHQQYDLLTRAFALAVAIIPDRTSPTFKSGPRELRVAEARKASLTQGMLAADILLSLAPPEASALAKAWVTSEDGWVPSLLQLIPVLSRRTGGVGPAMNGMRGPQGRPGFVGALPPHLQAQREEVGFEMVVRRGLDVIKRLAGRIRDGMRVRKKGDVGRALEAQADVEGTASVPGGEKEDDGLLERVGEDEGQPSRVSIGEETRPEMDDDGQEKEVEAEVGAEAETEDEEEDGVVSDEDWQKAVFWKGVLGEALPKEHSIVGALLTDEADGFVIRELLALSNLDA
jgi:SWI/SNF chromatin-remodeling complex subunit SWI1